MCFGRSTPPPNLGDVIYGRHQKDVMLTWKDNYMEPYWWKKLTLCQSLMQVYFFLAPDWLDLWSHYYYTHYQSLKANLVNNHCFVCFFAIDTNGNKAIFRLITHAMRLVIGLFSVQILKWLIVLWPNIFCNEWIGNYVTISILVYVVSVKLLQKTKRFWN